MKHIMTIGYEAAPPDLFDAALLREGVDLLVDVRAVAVSRKRGFSKTALADRLRDHGIDYLHLRDLGDPKPGREAARAGRWSDFHAIYGAHIETPAASAAMATLVALAKTRRVALLCYEADASTCHRKIVADRIAKGGELSVDHLRVTQSEAVADGRSRTDHHPGEGRAASQ